MRGVCAPRRPLAAPFAVPCRLQRTTPHTLHGMWGAVAGGRGRGVGRWRLWAARASVVGRGALRVAPASAGEESLYLDVRLGGPPKCQVTGTLPELGLESVLYDAERFTFARDAEKIHF